MTLLPDRILNLMSPEDRAKLGAEGVTATEALAKWQGREERKIHDTIERWLTLRQLPYIHARMDQKSTIRKGWPDFTVTNAGRVACVEVKAPGGKVSADQSEVLAELIANRTPATVAFSAADAIEFFKTHLNL